ncbi:MAG: chondroitinase-B domain-containing protein [Myxococcota bacterium]
MMRIAQGWQAVAVALLMWLAGAAAHAAELLVADLREFERAVAALQPGDRVVLANGTWSDVELKLRADGTAERPIELVAETPGKVIISGQSNLRFSGSYILVSGLVFRDGFTPTSEVIAFRTAKDELANHSRVTNTVIDDFSNPERYDSDTWVAIYGKGNRLDHNSLLNKGNRGVTLAVRLNSPASRENGHVIEYNYFQSSIDTLHLLVNQDGFTVDDQLFLENWAYLTSKAELFDAQLVNLRLLENVNGEGENKILKEFGSNSSLDNHRQYEFDGRGNQC